MINYMLSSNVEPVKRMIYAECYEMFINSLGAASKIKSQFSDSLHKNVFYLKNM